MQGSNLDIIQKPQIRITIDNEEYTEMCNVINSTLVVCKSPKFPQEKALLGEDPREVIEFSAYLTFLPSSVCHQQWHKFKQTDAGSQNYICISIKLATCMPTIVIRINLGQSNPTSVNDETTVKTS